MLNNNNMIEFQYVPQWVHALYGCCPKPKPPDPTAHIPINVYESLKTIEEYVITLQKLLNQNGHEIKEDGFLGPTTIDAIKKFQKDKGLEIDGKIGIETLKAINDNIYSL
jgi:peptidoglycan hydrolase-like protein with peptidoglycan-binding domain